MRVYIQFALIATVVTSFPSAPPSHKYLQARSLPRAIPDGGDLDSFEEQFKSLSLEQSSLLFLDSRCFYMLSPPEMNRKYPERKP